MEAVRDCEVFFLLFGLMSSVDVRRERVFMCAGLLRWSRRCAHSSMGSCMPGLLYLVYTAGPELCVGVLPELRALRPDTWHALVCGILGLNFLTMFPSVILHGMYSL